MINACKESHESSNKVNSLVRHSKHDFVFSIFIIIEPFSAVNLCKKTRQSCYLTRSDETLHSGRE